MSPIVALFVLVNAVALLALPRRWAPLPFMIGACYMTRDQAVNFGAISFTVVRILIAVGIARAVIRGEGMAGRFNILDGIVVGFGVWMVFSVVFHTNPDSPLLLRTRDLYEGWGLYFLFRVFCRSREDVIQLSRMVAITLIPIALTMLVEKATGVNEFSRFGGVPRFSTVRDGAIRAQGPFTHAILAGTIGAVCFPLMAGLWSSRRTLAVAGGLACVGIVIASGSSGPILATVAGIAALLLWPMRTRMRWIQFTAIAAYVGLEIVMKRPAVFIIADIDITGGSTSWYRAELMRSAFAHLNEWWLVGTDYTRHWMPTGVPYSPNQTDITNHYIAMGVVGGLLLMLLFILILVRGFAQVGKTVRLVDQPEKAFAAWAVGAALFGHTVSMLSVSYYDHTIMFLYFTLAATTAGLESARVAVPQVELLPKAANQSPGHFRKFRKPGVGAAEPVLGLGGRRAKPLIR